MSIKHSSKSAFRKFRSLIKLSLVGQVLSSEIPYVSYTRLIGAIKNMRYIFFILLFFLSISVFGQNLKQSDLVGCWKLVDIVDTSKFVSFGKPAWEDVMKFEKEGRYTNRNGAGEFEIKEQAILLYKLKYTKEDHQMAEYLGKSLKEATKVRLEGVEITGDFLFYKVYSEEEPTILFVKYEKMNCR